jgi:hypothetical protein
MNEDGKLRTYVELAGAVAVLVGLIFVGLELRQNQQMMRTQIRNDLSVGLNDVLLVIASNEQLASARQRFDNGEPLTPVQIEQLWSWENAIFRYWENVHYQYRNELYDETEFLAQREAWRRSMVRSRAHRFHWCGWGETYSPEFRADMNNLTPVGACDEFASPAVEQSDVN